MFRVRRNKNSFDFVPETCAEFTVAHTKTGEDAWVAITHARVPLQERSLTINHILARYSLKPIVEVTVGVGELGGNLCTHFKWPVSNRALQHAILRYLRDGYDWQLSLVEVVADLTASADDLEPFMCYSGAFNFLTYQVHPSLWVYKIDPQITAALLDEAPAPFSNAVVIYQGYRDLLLEVYQQWSEMYYGKRMVRIDLKNSMGMTNVYNRSIPILEGNTSSDYVGHGMLRFSLPNGTKITSRFYWPLTKDQYDLLDWSIGGE